MLTIGETVKPSFRQILADSHVAAAAIAVLLFSSLDSAFWALWGPLRRAADFLITAVAILDVPYVSQNFTVADRFFWFVTLLHFFNSLVYLVAAELLSRWVYGMGPLRSLSKYRTSLAGRIDA